MSEYWMVRSYAAAKTDWFSELPVLKWLNSRFSRMAMIAAEFQRHRRQIVRRRVQDVAADPGGTREQQMVERQRGERLPHLRPARDEGELDRIAATLAWKRDQSSPAAIGAQIASTSSIGIAHGAPCQ